MYSAQFDQEHAPFYTSLLKTESYAQRDTGLRNGPVL